MDIDKKQFDKAQSFVLDTLEKEWDKKGATKEALQSAVETIEEEFRTAKNIDYQRSILALAGQISNTIKDFNKKEKENQSQ